MAEEREVSVTHEEVEGFVAKLRDFHGSLNESEQAMLDTVLDPAQGAETGGYGKRTPRSGGGSEESWNDLIGWIEEQGEDDTRGSV